MSMRRSGLTRRLRGPSTKFIVSGLALLAAAATLAAVRSPEPESRNVGARAATLVPDTHGYPRTYLVYSGWTEPRVLARYDMLVGFATNWDVAALRRLNRNGIFLLQPGLNPGSAEYREVFVTHAGRAASWRGGHDQRLGFIRAVNADQDILHDPGGRLLGGWNLGGPNGRNTATFVARLFSHAARKSGLYSDGWDGVHSDNWLFTAIGARWFYGPDLDTDRDGRRDDLSTVRPRHADNLAHVGRLIRSYFPGKIVGGNGAWFRASSYPGSDPNAWRSTSNYTLIEHFDKFYETPGEAIAIARKWLEFPDPQGQPRYLAVLQRALDCDGSPIRLAPGEEPSDALMLDPCVMKSMRWGLTLSLMAGAYYEIQAWPDHGTRWWYDEYDGGVGIRRRGYLGDALGPARSLGERLYRRDFEHGIALHNSGDEARSVELGGRFRMVRGTQNPGLNDGSLVSSVVVPSKDGVILLRP
jgi:hypothetical protein